jgi:hypothetical protein
MAVASLNKMTVPVAAAGDGTSSTQGLLMPKLQYRFRVLLNGFGAGSVATELTKQVVDVQRPTINFPEITIPIYNSTLYLAGKATWNAVTLNVRDDATGEVAKLVGTQIQKQMDFSEQASAAAGIDYKFQMSIQILDGGNGVNAPNILETWELYGCYLADINYNQLSYASNEPVQIGMTVRYDNAVQTPTAGGIQVGVGQAVGRAIGTNITGIGT